MHERNAQDRVVESKQKKIKWLQKEIVKCESKISATESISELKNISAFIALKGYIVDRLEQGRRDYMLLNKVDYKDINQNRLNDLIKANKEGAMRENELLIRLSDDKAKSRDMYIEKRDLYKRDLALLTKQEEPKKA